jgi:hypothetical protein
VDAGQAMVVWRSLDVSLCSSPSVQEGMAWEVVEETPFPAVPNGTLCPQKCDKVRGDGLNADPGEQTAAGAATSPTRTPPSMHEPEALGARSYSDRAYPSQDVTHDSPAIAKDF